MKPIHKLLCKSLFASRRFYLLLLPLVGICARFAYRYSRVADPAQEGGLLCFEIYHSIFRWAIVVFVIIPSFLALIALIGTKMDRCEVLMKYENRGKWWADKNLGIFLFSLIYTAVINAVVLAAIIYGGHGSQLDSDFLSFMFLGCLFQLAGFMTLGNIYCIASLQIQRWYAGFIATYAAVVLANSVRDFLVYILPFDYFVTLEEYMFLTPDYLSLTADRVNPWHLAWLALIFILLYLFGLSIIRDKDIYWGDL